MQSQGTMSCFLTAVREKICSRLPSRLIDRGLVPLSLSNYSVPVHTQMSSFYNNTAQIALEPTPKISF